MAEFLDRRTFLHLSLLSARPLEFRTVGQSRDLTLVPLNRIFDERYAVYWKVSM